MTSLRTKGKLPHTTSRVQGSSEICLVYKIVQSTYVYSLWTRISPLGSLACPVGRTLIPLDVAHVRNSRHVPKALPPTRLGMNA